MQTFEFKRLYNFLFQGFLFFFRRSLKAIDSHGVPRFFLHLCFHLGYRC